MNDPVLSPLFFMVFGGAWLLGLTQFAVLFVVTKRLGMAFQQNGLSWSLPLADTWRLAKLMWGFEAPPAEAKVGGLLWAVRALQLGFMAAVAASMLLMTGAV